MWRPSSEQPFTRGVWLDAEGSSSDSWRGAAWNTLERHAHQGESGNTPGFGLGPLMGCPSLRVIPEGTGQGGQLRNSSASSRWSLPSLDQRLGENTPRWETALHRACGFHTWGLASDFAQEVRAGQAQERGRGGDPAAVRRHGTAYRAFQQRTGSDKRSKMEDL